MLFFFLCSFPFCFVGAYYRLANWGLENQQQDVLELVEISQDIRRQRHERIREIQWEREHLPERRERRPPPQIIEERRLMIEERRPAIEEERVIEREVVYEGRRPPPRYLR